MITKVHTVAVVVSNAEKATRWYTEKLGFQVRPESSNHWVVVGAPGASFGLHLCEANPKFETAVEPGNTGILMQVDDVEKTVAELRAKGVKIAQDVTREPWGIYAMIEDLDGNVFWLMPGH